ncbi:hybrid sensor histidine kinase/response regulator transcription factor [Geofilum rubicundum]|uniref:hybrid sensor histidine kinase/response regulator transcription factor n=1 Tax=Geofilum rubicundum TaxID=472113 RepID=UPI00138E4745|nr:two-component regulator propeller domain-containing protein [Geofilum rubicundum]
MAAWANISFYNINEMFGISIRETASASMDDYGFVWVSSKTGILRLTDDDYRLYQLPFDTPDVITVKLIYQNSELLAYSNNGQIFRYDIIQDEFILIANLGKQLNFQYLTVQVMVVDESGAFWLATNSGLIHYKDELLKIHWEETEIGYLEWYSTDQLFVADDDDLSLFNTVTNKRISLLNFSDFPIDVSYLQYEEAENDLWLGSVSSGLYKYQLNKNQLLQVSGVPKQPILDIESVSDSTMMIGVDGQGLWEVGKQDLIVYNIYKEDVDKPNSLQGNGVYDIFQDDKGRVWVCTYSRGVSYYNKTSSMLTHVRHLTNNPNSLSNDDVNSIIEDARGNLWFATNNGISRWDVAHNKWEAFYHNKQKQAQVFLSLSEDANGNIWAGSYSSGVYLIDGKTGAEIQHILFEGNESLFKSNFVFNITNDSQGNVWIGGVQGEVLRYNMATHNITSYGSHPVYIMKELDASHMLLGCTYGLSVLNKHSSNVDIVLNGYIIHDMLVQGNMVWLATVGEGLVLFNLQTRQVTKFTTEIGLPSNFVNSILLDQGFLWLGTENGICRFNPLDETLETFPSIQSLSRISYNRNAHFMRKNGEMIWGTNQGAVMFNPSAIEKSPSEGQIYFQDIRILGKSLRTEVVKKLEMPVDSIQSLRLKHNQNNLLIDMVPLGMTYGTKFSWFLEGFDTEWSRPVTNRTLNYTNLPTGSYQLKIRLYDNSMSEIIDERTLEIVKKPPFWEAWWFLLLVGLFLLSAFYLSLKYYINLIKQLHSEEKIRFFASTAHDMRTSLSLIKGPIDELGHESNLSEKGSYYLDLARSQVDRLVGVVTQLMDFQKADIDKEQLLMKRVDVVAFVRQRVAMFESYAATHQIAVVFNPSIGTLNSEVDERLMEKVVDNLLSNAIKYSKPQTSVLVNLRLSRRNWVLEVKDQGIGISKSARQHLFREFYRGENAINAKIVGSGIGLLLVRKYVGLHGGKIDWESQENNGSTFTVTVPMKEFSGETMDEVSPVKPHAGRIVPPLPVGEGAVRDYTVLVVEDNEELRCFLQQSMDEGFNILTAADGIEGWEIIQRELPDLIVSDILMPGRDGYELCQLVKSSYETSHIPVILLTALSEKNDQLHGLELGADDYLTKPFDSAVLKQRIISVISNRSLVRERALKLISGGPQHEAVVANELNDQFVKRALEVVSEQLANPEFNKELFASEMNVSGSLLYKKIKGLTDQSPSDFIRVVRLTKALELLQMEQHSITEVSELCGFASVGYFSTVFKKHYGKSPSEFQSR